MEKDKYLKLYCNLVELGYGISDDLYGNLEGLHREISLFLNPGQARLHLQEWLLEKYEPGILSDPDLNLLSDNPFRRLHFTYLQLGIGPQSLEIIQGLCGQDAGISLLIDLSELVKYANTDAVNTLKKSENLMGYITENSGSIFSSDLKIFPPTFPQKYMTANKNIINDIDNTLKYWENHLETLKSQTLSLNLDTIYEEPSPSQIKKLKFEIERFSREVKKFRHIYESEIQPELAERYYGLDQNSMSISASPHFAPLLGIGVRANDCKKSHEKIVNLLEDIENIWSMINVIRNLA